MKKYYLLISFLISTQFPASAMLSKEANLENDLPIQQKINQTLQPKILSAKKVVSPKKTVLTQANVNKIVCETAIKVFHKINKNWIYPEPKGEFEVSSKFWKTTWYRDTHNNALCPSLTLNTQFSITQLPEALEDLIDNTAVLECRLAQETVQLFCLKEILGEDDFRTYLSALSVHLKEENTRETYDVFKMFPARFMEKVRRKETPGSIKYIANIPEYATYKPHGSARGINLYCVGNDQYIGFSEIYETGPQPLEQRINEDCEFFCDPTKVEALPTLHADFCQSFHEDKALFTKLHNKAQNDFHLIFDVKALKKTQQDVANFRKKL